LVPAAIKHNDVVGQATASLGLTPGPLQVLQLAAALALTFVAKNAFPALSLTTQSVVPGTHDTAFKLLPESTVCV
jgi:hypothetical protein